MDQRQTKRTVRELGGEIWAEMEMAFGESQISWKTKGELTDLIMGVLARHVGALIENDEGMPVEPMPRNQVDDQET